MQLITLKLNDIHPYEKNPRRNDQAIEAVAESIKQCGYCAPIVVDENHIILAGHTRLKAMKRLGWKECQVCIKEGLTEEQKRKYRLLDNKTNELSEWDLTLLDAELEGLDFEGFDFGFDVQSGGADENDMTEHGSLSDQFLVPPFSILRGDKGEWINRKRAWQNLGIRSEAGRG